MGEFWQITNLFHIVVICMITPQIHAADSNCTCGNVYSDIGLTFRVVGGGKSDAKNHPELADVMVQNTFICGGSVVTTHHVLTAAHCVPDKSKIKEYSVGLGMHDRIQQKSKYIKIFKVKEIITHKHYKKMYIGILINDIALLKLDGLIEFTEYIQAVCLPFNVDLSAYRAGAVEGWGATSEGGFTARFPEEAVVSLLSVEQCRMSGVHKLIKHVPDIDRMVLCAYRRNVDTCQGDSGGPLIITTPKGRRVQIGIVSFGVGCANDEGYPGIYTRISNYLDWLKQNANGFCAGP